VRCFLLKRFVVIGRKGDFTRLAGSFSNRKEAETRAGLLALEPTDEDIRYSVKAVRVKGYKRKR